MNDIQKKLLEIATVFTKVCNKLNLKYFAIGGTCLGAVRHGGFIPWDDDMDFAMPRDDYETFIKEGQKYIDSQYFIQCYETEKNYYFPYAKLRDSNTTAIEKATKALNINQGLWVDIFPLDGIPESQRTCKRINWWRFNILERRYLVERYSWGGFKNRCYNTIIKILIPSKKFAYILNKKLTNKYKYDDSDYLWWNWPAIGKYKLNKEWFNKPCFLSFENVSLRVPFDYCSYLKEQYGDWEKLPPLEKRKSDHTLYIVDINKPYKNYM